GDERADRLDLEVGTVARLHGLAMIGFLVLTIVVVRMAHRGDAAPRVTQRSHELLVVLLAQAVLGYWQYFTGVPELLVAFHVLGAALVWLAVLRLWMSLPADDAAPAGWRGSGTTDPAAVPAAATAREGRRTGAVTPSATPWGRSRDDEAVVTAGPAAPLPAPVETGQPVGDTDVDPDRPWVVIVWNDPINLMSYVTYVLQK